MSHSFQNENISLLRGPYMNTVEPLLRGHPDERPPPLERPLDNVNFNISVLIFTPDERPPLLKGHFSYAKGVASQEGFHCAANFCINGHIISDICEYLGVCAFNYSQ